MADGRRVMAALALVLALGAGAGAQPAPDLVFETRGSEFGAEARLGGVSEEQLRIIVRLVGLEEPGEPIQVVLAAEDSDLARGTPSWIAGFAHGPTGTVVLFPSRSPHYPHDSLEAVLYHEVAHILIGRAAAGAPVPRWFNEGLSTAAERPWHFEDRRQLAWALATSGRIRMAEVDTLFARGSGDAAAAYALAGAFVRYLIDAHGPHVPARILAAMADGAGFDVAFADATGTSLPEAEQHFHARLTSWERWVPLLTSPFALWTVMTLLALYAIAVRWRRRAERRRQWDEEEADEPEAISAAGGRGNAAASDRPLQASPHGADSPDDEPPPRGGLH